LLLCLLLRSLLFQLARWRLRRRSRLVRICKQKIFKSQPKSFHLAAAPAPGNAWTRFLPFNMMGNFV